MNYVFIAGNIGKAEGRKVGEDFAIKFSVASTFRVKNGSEWENKTEWFNCEYWAKSEKFLDNFKQCAGVAVMGTQRTTKKDDKTYVIIKAIDIKFVFPKKEKEGGDEPF